MIQGEAIAGIPAVLAGVAVPLEQVASRQRNLFVGNSDIVT